MQFQIPSYGAAPLSTTFVGVRGLQLVCMIIIIGLTANFINAITSGGISPPQEVIGALTITCLGALYTALSLPYYFSPAHLGLLIMTAFDSLLLIAWIVVACSIGKPLSFANCYRLDNKTNLNNADMTYNLVQSLVDSVKDGRLDLYTWARATRTTCMESKAIWGLAITLTVLYATSVILLPTLFYKNKKAGGAAAAPKEVA